MGTTSEVAAVASPVGRISTQTAFAAATISVALLALLHLLNPELDPSLHMVSEYALGSFGFVMGACFLSLAIACAGLGIALLSYSSAVGTRLGAVLLLAAAIGLSMAAFFPMDPLGVRPEDASFSGRMHGVSAMIGGPSLGIAIALLTIVLYNRPPWSRRPAPLILFAVLNWAALLAMMGMIAILIQQGPASIGGYVGWANRLLMVSYAAWIIACSWPLARARR
jgi:hypothetical protein